MLVLPSEGCHAPSEEEEPDAHRYRHVRSVRHLEQGQDDRRHRDGKGNERRRGRGRNAKRQGRGGTLHAVDRCVSVLVLRMHVSPQRLAHPFRGSGRCAALDGTRTGLERENGATTQKRALTATNLVLPGQRPAVFSTRYARALERSTPRPTDEPTGLLCESHPPPPPPAPAALA